MGQQTNELIIGAVIGLLSALLTFMLTSVFQLYRDERDRKWAKEDARLQRRLRVLDQRLSDVRFYIDKQYEVVKSLLYYEIDIARSKNALDIEPQFLELSSLIAEASKMAPSVVNINDDELSKLRDDLLKLLSEEEQFAQSLRDKKYDGQTIHIDEEEEKERREEFIYKFTALRKSMMKRIDELSGFDN